MNKEANKIMSWKDRTWLDEHDDGYEEFYKKGGTYVIPVERFNEFIKQKEVIDKAIEYIEKFIPIDEDTILMRERQRDYLLDILKEVSE